jgi:hypothetical protein
MTDSAAQKLLRVLLDADLQYQLNGTPIHVTCARAARKHYGEARRELRRVAALGPDADRFMQIFVEEMNQP